jgi:Asp-tRNA(Asn)/Glu-tRNA(Gln) amidotransferase A subunit family amidase
VNGILNAVVDERYKDALEEAKEADRMIQSGEWSKERLEKERPFHGVPISTKESTCVKGNYWRLQYFNLKIKQFITNTFLSMCYCL